MAEILEEADLDPQFIRFAKKAYRTYENFKGNLNDRSLKMVSVFGHDVPIQLVWLPVLIISLLIVLSFPWITHHLMVKPMLRQEKERVEAVVAKRAAERAATDSQAPAESDER
eukprot:CAMPEP_0180638856 /NCGR_PEP_ID=MMETSP1037_2-20121125/44613_1 /TAXON_ID=632150 /ORGANISM="Azadinium spinosum, Strain 3D9" /LENGTH=112 /DNA_ID=CAMNT_0022660543 /DNA_START=60 /DNA_END=398 /DNA_ORIENTATION=-